MRRNAFLGVVFASLAALTASAHDGPKGSLKPGDSVPSFSPYNVTGADAGKARCLV